MSLIEFRAIKLKGIIKLIKEYKYNFLEINSNNNVSNIFLEIIS